MIQAQLLSVFVLHGCRPKSSLSHSSFRALSQKLNQDKIRRRGFSQIISRYTRDFIDNCLFTGGCIEAKMGRPVAKSIRVRSGTPPLLKCACPELKTVGGQACASCPDLLNCKSFSVNLPSTMRSLSSEKLHNICFIFIYQIASLSVLPLLQSGAYFQALLTLGPRYWEIPSVSANLALRCSTIRP